MMSSISDWYLNLRYRTRFQPPPSKRVGERFWVEIVQRDGDLFTGRVDSYTLLAPVSYGDHIEFHSDNVYEIFDSSLR
jgi:hypothetical protein